MQTKLNYSVVLHTTYSEGAELGGWQGVSRQLSTHVCGILFLYFKKNPFCLYHLQKYIFISLYLSSLRAPCYVCNNVVHNYIHIYVQSLLYWLLFLLYANFLPFDLSLCKNYSEEYDAGPCLTFTYRRENSTTFLKWGPSAHLSKKKLK